MATASASAASAAPISQPGRIRRTIICTCVFSAWPAPTTDFLTRLAEYSANQVKKSVVGAGHAEKAQVELMVRRLLPGCTVVKADAADALAVAICHAHRVGTLNAWQPKGQKAAR